MLDQLPWIINCLINYLGEKKKRKKRANFSPAVNDKQRFSALCKNIINELFHESIIVVVDIIRSNLSIHTDTIRKITSN